MANVWFIVHEEQSYNENARALGFNINIHNVNELKQGDEIVYYFKGKRIKGNYIIKHIVKSPQKVEPNWTSTIQFEIQPIIELSIPLDFNPLIQEISFLKGKGSNWGRSIQGVNAIRKLTTNDYDLIKKKLRDEFTVQNYVSYESYLVNQEKEIVKSKNDTKGNRLKRLHTASTKPQSQMVVSKVYKRNPDVVIEVLDRANGTCEECQQPAPFIRKSDGSPYLEVHHKIPLSLGGEDSVNNAEALCPNCHKRKHFG
jgi:5-methylcytosine-specific restriction endonuclease McrA